MTRPIDKIIIHCTDSPDDRDIGYDEINQWHKLRFSGVTIGGSQIYCGYHFIIRRDGTVELGRPEHIVGAHCAGHNRTSIGVVWVGKEKIAEAQLGTLISLCMSLMIKYGLDPADVYGHSSFNSQKTCPNLDLRMIRNKLNQEATHGSSELGVDQG